MAMLFKDCPKCNGNGIHQTRSPKGWRTFCAECWATTEAPAKGRQESMRMWNSGRVKPSTVVR